MAFHESTSLTVSSYIHGGAYRDPAISSLSIRPALPFLLDAFPSAPESVSHQPWQPIAAVASLNHRLSSYEDHPTSPSSPSDPARNATHPDHIHDILDALRWLQQHYPESRRYVLVGHSVGATIAFQTVMGLWHPRGANELPDSRYSSSSQQNDFSEASVPMPTHPVAIVGVTGIYDFVRLRNQYAAVPIYQAFICSAFGTDDEHLWAAASPIAGNYGRTWPEGKQIVLAWSRGDVLVDEGQVTAMKSWLESMDGGGWSEGAGEKELVLLELQGDHDAIWEEGRELARAVRAALE